MFLHASWSGSHQNLIICCQSHIQFAQNPSKFIGTFWVVLLADRDIQTDKHAKAETSQVRRMWKVKHKQVEAYRQKTDAHAYHQPVTQRKFGADIHRFWRRVVYRRIMAVGLYRGATDHSVLKCSCWLRRWVHVIMNGNWIQLNCSQLTRTIDSSMKVTCVYSYSLPPLQQCDSERKCRELRLRRVT